MDDLIKIVERIKKLQTQNSVTQARGSLFLPYTKIPKKIKDEFVKNKLKKVFFEDKVFVFTVFNRILTQRHRDILDLLLLNAKRKDGKYISCTSLYEIAKKIGIKKNNRKIREYVTDLSNVAIEVKHKRENVGFGMRIVNEYFFKDDKYCFVFDTKYIIFFQIFDIAIDYSHNIDSLISEQDGYIKAVIRYCFATKFVKCKNVIEILKETGLGLHGISDRQKRKIHKIFKDNKDILTKKYAILYNNKTHTVSYKKNEHVRFFYSNEVTQRQIWDYCVKTKKKNPT